MSNPVRSAVRAFAEGGVALVATLNRWWLPRAPSPFTVGIHAPMREALTLTDLTVIGSIPNGARRPVSQCLSEIMSFSERAFAS